MSSLDGTIRQRYIRGCPRDAEGNFKNHKCRGPWGYVVDGPMGAGGRRQVVKSGFETKQEARAGLRTYLEIRDKGVDDSTNPTVGEYLDLWLTGKRALRASTVKSYREHIDLYLKPHLGKRKLRDLKAQHVDAMFTAIGTAQRRKPLSAATIRRIHSTLRSALSSAVKRRFIPYNPAMHVELAVERRDATTVWSPEQVITFLTAVQGTKHHALFRLALVTGMRRGELAGLRWQDVDLKRALLRVEQQVVEIYGKRYVGPPKTKSGRRTVALDAETVDILRLHMDREDFARSRCGIQWTEADFVFTDEAGAGLKPEKIGRLFVLLTSRAGLPRIRLHGLRHTSASLALEAGVPMKVVSERLGHSTTGITADLYTHVSPALAQNAANAIAGLLAPVAGSEK